MKTNKPRIVVFLERFCLFLLDKALKPTDEVPKGTESNLVQGQSINHYYDLIRPFRLTHSDIVDSFRSINKAFYSTCYRGNTIFKEEIIWNPNTNKTNTLIIK